MGRRRQGSLTRSSSGWAIGGQYPPLTRGQVKFVRPEKGWGAIVSPDLPDEVWVHSSSVVVDGMARGWMPPMEEVTQSYGLCLTATDASCSSQTAPASQPATEPRADRQPGGAFALSMTTWRPSDRARLASCTWAASQ